MDGIGKKERERHRVSAAKFGNMVRDMRLRRGLTQEQVANRADVAIGAYGCLERGVAPSGQAANPTFLTMLRVFEVLGVEPILKRAGGAEPAD